MATAALPSNCECVYVCVYVCVCPTCSCLKCCSIREEKEQSWPVHCGRERERSGKGNDRQLEESREGFGAYKNENEGRGTQEKRQTGVNNRREKGPAR